jgi:hypothetical protein
MMRPDQPNCWPRSRLGVMCEQNTILYEGVTAGKGNADKAAVIAAVRARGFSPADDDEADALAILLWAIETPGGVR